MQKWVCRERWVPWCMFVCSDEHDHWVWALMCGERTQQGCSSGVGGRAGTGTAQC